MTKEQINEAIRAEAEANGFKATMEAGLFGIVGILSDELYFTIMAQKADSTDRNAGKAEWNVTTSASVRRTGGGQTAEGLLKTADEIRRGAELVMKINSMNLTLTEEF